MAVRFGNKICSVAIALAILLFSHLPNAAEGANTTFIRGAEFTGTFDATVEGMVPSVGWHPVTLPDSWHSRLGGNPDSGWYRFSVEVNPSPVDAIYALRFDSVSPTLRVLVNGHLVHSDGEAYRDSRAIRAWPRLVGVPGALLRPGANEFHVEVRHGSWVRAGLPALQFGTHAAISSRFEHYHFLVKVLPQTLNLLSMTCSALLLLIWLRRRSETALGIFGLLFLIASFRNWFYFVEKPSAEVAGIVFFLFSMQVWTTVLMGAFALSLTGAHMPRYRLVLRWMSVLLPLMALALLVLREEWLPAFRAASYAFALGVAAFAVWILAKSAWTTASRSIAAMAAGFAVMMIASLHDFATLLAAADVGEIFWLPYFMPVVFALFSLGLIERVLRALREVEAMSTHLESRIQVRTAELAAANSAKTRFLAAASHDLRQPLHAVSLLVGLVREQIRGQESQHLIDKIQSSVDSMGGILKGLLDVSRLDAGAVKVELTEVRLDEMFEAIRRVEAPFAEAKGLSLRIGRCSTYVRTDRALAESILRNLVANATRYTSRGKVLLGARRRGNHVVVQVHDTGIGIAPEHREQIFLEFFQVGNIARDRTLGLGLGLSIVRRTAELLGHPLRLFSELGKGTCFEIDMPIATNARPMLQYPGAADQERHDLTGSFVVLLEDDLDVRNALEELLVAWGCHVLAADSVAAATAALESHLRAPDLLLCDYRLPHGVNGVESIQRLRELAGAQIPALLISGDIAAPELRHMQSLSVPVLFKPVAADVLRTAIATALSGAAAAAQDTPT